MQNLEKLSRNINYQFKDQGLLEAALTHRSMGQGNNERLEFLGDSILNFIITDHIYQQFPKASEGRLSRLRATLVRGETLTIVARRLELGEYLKLGQGEMKSGGFRRASILADALEAIIGAVYLDGGIQAAEQLVLGLFDEQLTAAEPSESLKDPKTRLQEYLQGRKLPLPNYRLDSVTGEPHAQHFVVGCNIEGVEEQTGEGVSRRKAEQAAAHKVLEKLALLQDDKSGVS